MEPLGFGSRRFWVTMFGPDGEPSGVMIDVDDAPMAIDDDEADQMIEGLGEVLLDILPGGTVAILCCRPGRDAMNRLDRRLALDLARAAARTGVPLRPIYFANDVMLRVFAADDLVGVGPSPDRERPH